MAVIDCFTFNGEFDLLEIRLNILNDYVDEFVIVEATETFSGKPKPLYYEKEKERYKQWHSKIKYHVVSPPYKEDYVVLANGSPNTRGAAHWKTEFCQKESIKDALTHLKDGDTVFVGDVDEIYDPSTINSAAFTLEFYPLGTVKMQLRVYAYYLNNLSSEQFWGTNFARYKTIKEHCLNHLRSDTNKRNQEFVGWHFTSMGGYDEVKRKLSDSYTRESYWTEEVEKNLYSNVNASRDFLSRPFTYKIDESRWPKYLKDNREKYKHLLRV